MREVLFFLTDYDSGNYTTPHPIYGNDFNIVVEKETEQMFYREKLGGSITFVAEDFTWIMAQPFDCRLDVIITITDSGNVTKQWHGFFSRTDCTINEVDGILTVTPEPQDEYTDILNKLDVEFDLAELPLPQKRAIINVPPVLQLYGLGDDYVTNYWQGEVWTMEVEPINNSNVLNDICFYEELFFQNPTMIYCRILQSSSGTKAVKDAYNINNDAYKYGRIFNHNNNGIDILQNAQHSNTPTKYGQVYSNGTPTGQYYAPPTDTYSVFLPFMRNRWTEFVSYWLRVQKTETATIDLQTETLPLDASYTIGDLLRGLLAANSLGAIFQDTDEYSEFFYKSPTSPITGWASGWTLNITAKSNIIKLGADAPATKVPCALGTILNFLKTALNVYWHIGSGNKLHLEHVAYYKNGGSYSGTPTTQFDLTQMLDPRNDKPYAFGQNQYQFEKYEMPEIVKYQWMDESDFVFDGSGLMCLSNYVQLGRTEEITVPNFTTNIAKMFMRPDEFCMDGMSAVFTAANGRTDYLQFTRDIGGNWRVPNGELSMWDLQNGVLLYDAPCDKIKSSGLIHNNVDYKRTKYNEVVFPAVDADPTQHIKTNVGNGEVNTLTINIVNVSIKAKLKYGNE